MTLRSETSAESAARFRETYEGRLAHLPVQIRQGVRDAKVFREFVLEMVGRVPALPSVIHERVISEWGHVPQKRVERALYRLRDDGLVKRTPDGYVRSRP